MNLFFNKEAGTISKPLMSDPQEFMLLIPKNCRRTKRKTTHLEPHELKTNLSQT